jgi:hypothetical protein
LVVKVMDFLGGSLAKNTEIIVQPAAFLFQSIPPRTVWIPIWSGARSIWVRSGTYWYGHTSRNHPSRPVVLKAEYARHIIDKAG